MTRSVMWLFACAFLLLTSGCVGYGSLTIEDDHPVWLRYDSTWRGQVFVPCEEILVDAHGNAVTDKHDKPVTVKRWRSLSEPPPDSGLQSAISAALSGSYGGASGSASFSFAQTLIKLAARTERVELLRDALFRLSEAAFNLDVDEAEFSASYREVLRQVLRIEQAAAISESTDNQARFTEEEARLLKQREAAQAKLEQLLSDLKTSAPDERAQIEEQVRKGKAEVEALEETLRRLRNVKYAEAESAAKLRGALGEPTDTPRNAEVQPLPFTVEQLKDTLKKGLKLTFKVETASKNSPDNPKTDVFVLRIIKVDPDSNRFEFTYGRANTEPPRTIVQTYDAEYARIRYNANTTEISNGLVEIGQQAYECTVYTRHSKASNSTVTQRVYYINSMPGVIGKQEITTKTPADTTTRTELLVGIEEEK